MPNTVSTFAPETLTAIAGAVTNYCKADTDRAFALHEFMRLVGDEPSYDNWMLARGAAIQGYKATKPNANDAACDTFWSRYVKQLREYVNEQGFDMHFPEKPKAATPAAEAMRKARSNPFAEATKAEAEAVIAEVTERVKAGDVSKEVIDTLGKARARLEAIAKSEKKASEKAAKDAEKSRRDPLIAWIKEAPSDVLAVVEFLHDALSESTPDADRLQAWKNVAALAKKHATPTKGAKSDK